MQASTLETAVLMFGACLARGTPALAQSSGISDADCQSPRQRLAEHARMSEGVRRAVAAQEGAGPAASASPTPAAPSAIGRADAIRTRLEQIPDVPAPGDSNYKRGVGGNFNLLSARQVHS